MMPMPSFTAFTMLNLLLVLTCAAGTRAWYLVQCVDQGRKEPALVVQGPSPLLHLEPEQRVRARTPARELDNLAANLADMNEFRGLAPLSKGEEPTAHISPGYPWLLSFIATINEQADFLTRWVQCVLGVLTAGCYFFFARRAFRSTMIATLAGLLIAFDPFFIVNAAELNDGVVATFLLGLCLMLGTRGSQQAGTLTCLLFGLALAALAMVRAELLPFGLIALLWFLWHCRRIPYGWWAGFLAFFGFVAGVGPWVARDYLLFERPVPIADSAYLHLWMGSNKDATGATLSEPALRASLGDERVQELLKEANQAKRYHLLRQDVEQELQNHPNEIVGHRIDSLLAFVFGESWFKNRRLTEGDAAAALPEEMADYAELIFQGTLLGMLLLALLGWRFSHPWRRYGRLAALAAIWLPVPYILCHAESLSGPRLPLDGVLMCYAAFALASLVPGLTRLPQGTAPAPKQ